MENITKLVLFFGTAFTCSFIIAICILLIAISSTFPSVKRSRKEKLFLDPKAGQFKKFPSIEEPHSVHLSVIVPAYNEQDRLPPMLNECTRFLEERSSKNEFSYEIIVVSDGSTDKTIKVAHNYSEKFGTDKIRVLELETNRGKGGAVRLGMFSARGAMLLFADADGATKFSDLTKVEQAMNDTISCDYQIEPSEAAAKAGISIGSRAQLEEESMATRSPFRNFLMRGFHFLVWLLAVKGIKDTQCGFKLLTRTAAKECFGSLHVERWAFDVELLYIAQCLKIPIAEVSVNWTEVDGSKIVPVWSWLQIGMDLGLIWLRYTIGAWKIRAQMPKEK